jgi:alkanesulfonate monooxygenase SsuD/methylene tetrahydromethanopterin reductase-like flavin-dependent oxidoreductase (luciferase family)
MPLTLAIIGGPAHRFQPYVDLYHRSLERFGKPMLPVAVHSPGHVAATDKQAQDDIWPHYRDMMTRIGRERGWPPVTHEQFEREVSPDGALYVGSPATVTAKIVATMTRLGIARFDMKYSNGALPHDKLMTSIELFAKEVAPRVRETVTAAGAAARAGSQS